MLVRILRNATPEEIEERIRKFEKEYGMSFEKFEELSFRRKLSGKLTKNVF